MTKIMAEAARIIDERTEEVYAFLRDYKVSHRQILPSDAFHDFTVEEGGEGAGTVIRFRFTSPGRSRVMRMKVSEPVPGLVLEERDLDSSMVTRFTLTPIEGGAQTQVHIHTEWEGASGFGGFMERTFAPGYLQKVYARELALLEAMRGGASAPPHDRLAGG